MYDHHNSNMGIYKLQTFIQQKCNAAIQPSSLQILSGKRVAIDVISLIYKYKKGNDMLYKLFMFCTIFRNLNIHMCMVFDGIPSIEKMETIRKRKEDKLKAKEKLHLLKNKLFNGDIEKSSCIEKEIQYYENQSIHVSRDEIDIVKQLFTYYGIHWIVSNGEADYSCGYLAKNKFVDAVISDDTDMFVLGCPVVVRYISILENTCVLYKLNHILKILNLTYDEFRHICSVSKSDYNKCVDTQTFEQNYSDSKNSKQLKYPENSIQIYTKENEKAKEFLMKNHKSYDFQNLIYDKTKLQKFLKQYNFYHND